MSYACRPQKKSRSAVLHTIADRRRVLAAQMLNNLDTDLDGKVSLAEWLIAMKANADKSVDATKQACAHLSAWFPSMLLLS